MIFDSLALVASDVSHTSILSDVWYSKHFFLKFPEPINSPFLLKLVWVDFLPLTTKIQIYMLTFLTTLIPLRIFVPSLIQLFIVHSANSLTLLTTLSHWILANDMSFYLSQKRYYETSWTTSVTSPFLMFQRLNFSSVFWISFPYAFSRTLLHHILPLFPIT